MAGIGISPCPPFAKPPGVPGVIYDGNTVAWFKHNDMTNVIKDGANRVSQWSDKTGLGHHLLQAAGAAQPLWSASGLLFDGATDFMKCVGFVFNQPEFIYFCGRQITWTNTEDFCDGNTITGLIYQNGITPNISIYGGVALGADSNLILNTFGIIRALFNGAADSSLQINLNAATIGNGGLLNMSGFTLGSRSDAASKSNIEVKEIILRRSADNAATQLQIYNYLKNANAIP